MQQLLHRNLPAVLLAFWATFVFSHTLCAQATYEAKVSSGNWNDPATWLLLRDSDSDKDGVPDANDHVLITGNKTVLITTNNAEAAGIQLNSNDPQNNKTTAQLKFQDGSRLSVYGLLSMPGNGQRLGSVDMTDGGTLTLYAFSINGEQNQKNPGSWKPGKGTVEFIWFNTLPEGKAWRTFNNLVINGGTTHLSQEITVTGNLTIKAGILDVTDKNHEITLNGNWSNSNVFEARSGTVHFNGSKAAAIGGPSATVFYNLVVNKGASLLLNNDQIVAGSLHLKNGRLTIAAPYILALNGPQLKGAPFSSAKHIVTQVSGRSRGILKVSGINGQFTFPVGAAGNYLPAQVSVSDNSTFEVSVFKGLTRDGLPGSAKESEKANKVDAAWNINRTVGRQPITLTLNWQEVLEGDEFRLLANNRILIARNLGGPTWDEYLVGRADNQANTATRMNLSEFGAFRVSEPQADDAVLPVRFVDVRATLHNSSVLVSFANLTEENVEKYVVERSADGRSFSALGPLPALYNHNARADYRYTDNAPLSGLNFYRIRAVEKDGKVVYSTVVKVSAAHIHPGLLVFPNPVRSGQLSYTASNLPAGSYQLRVFNGAGQLVRTQHFTHGGGSVSESVPLRGAAAGSYYLEISGPVRWLKPFVVE